VSEQTNLIQEPGVVREPIPGVPTKYGNLVTTGEEAEKKQAATAPARVYHIKTPPGMTPAVRAKWDEFQAKHRRIRAYVHVNPPIGRDSNGDPSPHPGYWAAFRFFPMGGSEQMLSPHELYYLQSEDPKRLKVEVREGDVRLPMATQALLAKLTAEVKAEEERNERIATGCATPEDLGLDGEEAVEKHAEQEHVAKQALAKRKAGK
jgi:hypothetical protein